MRPIPEVMHPATAVEIINSMVWPEHWPKITAEVAPPRTVDDPVEGEVTLNPELQVHAEYEPCDWIGHHKPVVHEVTLAADGFNPVHVDQVYALTRNAWMALIDHTVRSHHEGRILNEIREEQATGRSILDAFHAAQFISDGGST